MKTLHVRNKLKWLGLLLAVGLAGCTSIKPSPEALPRAAVVCPDCRTVTLGRFPSSDVSGGALATVTSHKCRGHCHGVVTLSHGPKGYYRECAICEQSRFSCPSVQRL